MKKMLLFLLPLFCAQAYAMEKKESSAISQAEGLEKALRKDAHDKLIILAHQSPEVFMCLVSYARPTDPKFKIYQGHERSVLERLGMIIQSPDNWSNWLVHPSYAIALEEVIQELLEGKTTPDKSDTANTLPIYTDF